MTIVFFFDRMITIKHNKKVLRLQNTRLDFAKVEKTIKALKVEKAIKALLKLKA